MPRAQGTSWRLAWQWRQRVLRRRPSWRGRVRRRSLVRLVVACDRRAHVAPAPPRRANRLTGDLHQRLAIFVLVEGLLFLLDESIRLLHARIVGDLVGAGRCV